jgi:hypothetical protein
VPAQGTTAIALAERGLQVTTLKLDGQMLTALLAQTDAASTAG